MNREGGVDRVVHVAVLKIFNCENRILSQVGTLRDGQPVPKCVLPGSKLKKHEDVNAAAMRILSKDLGPISRQVVLGQEEKLIEYAQSRNYGIPSKYHRSVVHCECTEEAMRAEVPMPAYSDRLHPLRVFALESP